MKLYRIKTLFLGENLQEEAQLGFILAIDEESVYQYISDHFAWGEPWERQYENGVKAQIMENKGDYAEEYLGEGYDQKFAWEEVAPSVSEDEIKVLKKFGVLLKWDGNVLMVRNDGWNILIILEEGKTLKQHQYMLYCLVLAIKEKLF